MQRYILKTLGCKANLSDSQSIEQDLQSQGWAPVEGTTGSEEKPQVDLCIINSCTVTNEADRQTRRLAARLSRENPGAKVVVTGCAAEVDPVALSNAQGVDAVVGNQNKTQLVDLIINSHLFEQRSTLTQPDSKILGSVQSYESILSKHPLDREWPPANAAFLPSPTQLQGFSEKTRAFLKIQEGCNSFCTYCIIPYGRGPSRSLSSDEVIRQVKVLIGEGIQEVVITGTNIGDYGLDSNLSSVKSSTPIPFVLDDLLESILTQTSLERLRVSSLDPTEITPRILDLMRSEPRFCPHFHVSLQSPHSRILRLMKRKYSFEHVESCLFKIAQTSSLPGGAFVGMDVIAGFPGESDDEFEWTYRALESLPWSRLHVFPYSERTGTPATRLPHSVPRSTRIQRSKKLSQLSMTRLTRIYQNVIHYCKSENRPLQSVLLEKGSESGWFFGYTPNYLRIMIQKNQNPLLQRNQLVSVSPVDLMTDSKSGDVAFVSKMM